MNENAQVWVILTALVCVVAGAYLVALRGRPPTEDDSPLSEDAPGPYDDVSRILPGMQPPRPVRMSFRGKGSALLIPGVLLMITALTAKDYFHPTASWQKETFVSFFRVLCGLAVVLGLLQWRIYVRHRHLVSNGEVVLGRITKNYGSARNGQYLRYEFNTQSGETLSKTRTSWKLLDVGMRIPVFYDPYNPRSKLHSSQHITRLSCANKADVRYPPNIAKSCEVGFSETGLKSPPKVFTSSERQGRRASV